MFLASINAAVRRWIAYRRTVAALRALDTRELADLGIARANIPAVAARAVK
ncbi:MAG: DUF1127 domain-containing protein [Proteobacteria bacterium]|nr:DUF1127 domain-containing protein [Pseudomonadota bacterium]